MIANSHLIYLLNLYAEYIMRNDEPEVENGIKATGRNTDIQMISTYY